MKKVFIVPIYGAKVTVIYAKNKAYYKKVKKKHNLNDEADLADAFVYRLTTKKNVINYYIVFRVGSLENIAHEVTHLVNFIFEDRGVELDFKNDEPQAYLTGYLFDKVYKALKKIRGKKHSNKSVSLP